ncbi:MAG: hypothetical protein B7Y36_06910 [Novosphingobium sp. 28-62-57]|uniref:hypothetical protein n=1 Tax=unclassified Novosphingobium TaxID=2644732 RepID=UPI000BC91C26|nr:MULTISPECIES: hypothetical protein [unclassified Novosphingobium]OYW51089.1 MAG: hypothetical protein B7Z34_02110 [Novosphingobium sp. 12-62-10]OYZ11090.1 MAG: hypothetical protein B7Y36_06910 [Novosphingobium sp. 28-62-57]OZA39078.1 MAG: hypothetical protein B7X92_03295 [Novosphingobium sp. 17-62-9]HQS69781.1 hypothetical protein [Novosphingobium sp.]
MEKQIAKRIIDAVMALDPLLGEIDLAISEVSNEAERKALALKLGEIFYQLSEGFINPICREYPDLAVRD